jgi:hypothetical protein
MPTLYEAKGQARRLAEYLSSLDLTLNHGQALEAVARSHGAPNWNVFSSQVVQSDDSSGTPCSPTHASPPAKDLLTLRGLIAHAVAHEYGPVHIQARNDATTIYQRVRGRLVEIARLDALSAMDLGFSLGEAQAHSPGKAFVSGVGEVHYFKHELPVVGGRNIVLRTHHPKQAHELGLTEMRKWVKTMEATAGLVLIAGPANSANEILGATLGVSPVGESEHVAYRLTGKRGNWAEIPRIQDTQFFAEQLRTVLRSDPSAVITSLNCKENLEMALELVNTGHFVVATVEALANPVALIRRLFSFVSDGERARLEMLLQQGLKGILSQVVANPFCEECDGDGCSHCFKTGRGPAEYLSALWTPPKGWSLDDLLKGNLPYRTVVDDVNDKDAAGLRFPVESLSIIQSHASA